MKRILTLFVALVCTVALFSKEKNNGPFFPDTYNFKRGAEAVQNEKIEEALEYFNKDIQENPKSGYPYIMTALIRGKNGEFGKALGACEEGMKLLPKKDKSFIAYSYSIRSGIYLSLGDTVKALSDITLAIKTLPDDYDYYDVRAQLYYDMKNYDIADADYKKMLELRPGDVRCYIALGRSEAAREKFASAVDLYNYALKLDPEYLSYILKYRAIAYMRMEKWNDAVDDIVTILVAGNGWSEDAVLYACLLEEPYRSTLIMRLDVEQLKNPNNATWSYLKGVIYQYNDEYENAISAYGKANEIEPAALTYKRIADCCLNLGLYEKGLNSVETAISMDPDTYDNKETKINLLYLLGRQAEVLDMWNSILMEYPEFSYGYLQRGVLKRVTGDTSGAATDLSMAITLDATNSYAYVQRGDMYKLLGKDQLAEADYRKVIELEDTPEKYECIFFAYQGLGDTVKAVELMDSVIAKDTLYSGSYYNAACLYARMGNKEKSLSYLKQAFEKGMKYSYHVECDDDLKIIQSTDEFKALVSVYRGRQKAADVVPESNDVSPAAESVTSSVIPFTKEGGVCKVQCKINDLPLYFIFDTGAADVTMSLVEANFMFKNGYLTKRDVVGSQSYIDANGDVSVGTVVNLKNVTFGEHKLTNVKASIVRNQKAPLLLGQSVLGRLGRIEIDNKSSVIRIK